MKRKIELESMAMREQIAKTFCVTKQAVSFALSFKRNSPAAHAIREMALQNGGIYMEEKEMERPVKVLDAKGNIVKTL